jgi:HPt (histidine-containing phosphotransfer) domain-containing protein
MKGSEFETMLAGLKVRFVAALKDDEERLAAALASLIERPESPGELERLQRCAHRLAGASGTLGFAELSIVAARLERAVEKRDNAGELDLAGIRLAGSDLLTELAKARSTAASGDEFASTAESRR